MVKLVKGYAGCGKTAKLIDDVYSLILDGGVNPYQILVLTLSNTEKSYLVNKNKSMTNSKYLNIMSIDEFLKYILKKSPSDISKKVLSDNLAINIIGAICKTEFIENSALNNLTKSNTFFRELYNLFGLFKNNEIASIDEVIEQSEISETDKSRLYLISGVYKKYQETLANFNYLDYRDVVTSAINALGKSKNLLSTIKSRFEYVFVDGFQDITYLQFKLLKLISNPDNLYVYGDEYSRIQEFRGAWRDGLILDELKSQFGSLEALELQGSNRNNEILERALYLVEKYSGKIEQVNFEKTDNLKYVLFEDIQSEISAIACDILKKVKSGECKFSDFAVLIRDYEAKQKFIDFFKTYQIPINSELYNEDFQNFKLRLSRYIGVCQVCEKLGVEKFTKAGFDKLKVKSKSEAEILFGELNLYLENILDDTVKNKFVAMQEKYKDISLINVIFKNLGILDESQKLKVLEIIEKLSRIYDFYTESNFVGLMLCVAGKDAIMNSDFSKIFGKVLANVKDLSELYANVLRAKPEMSAILEVLDFSSSEQKEIENAVNLITFFKSTGLEFKHVYIPCLTENSFPKAVKSTYFISPSANDVVSRKLREGHKNFKNLIELDEESIEEEARLFYLGMTRAKVSLLVSTHKYEDKKQVQPSIFFKLLADADSENYSEFSSKNSKMGENDEAEIDLKNNDNKVEEEQKVLCENKNIKLNESAISTFLSCPRKFYLKSLLNIREESTFAASYGTIVHMVFEVFGKTHLDRYTKESMLKLADDLFRAKINPEEAIRAGFSEQNVELISQTDSLSLAEMEENFKNAVENLDTLMFFSQKPDSVATEKSFKFSVETLPNVTFDGRIDAICKFGGKYSVIDYKTGKNKKNKLDYYVSENGVNFLTKTGKTPTNIEEYQNSYEYQIPLYYLACQNAENLAEYKDKISTLGLQYIRPTSKDDGCKEDFVTSDMVEENSDKIIKNLKETVVDKILEKTYFDSKSDFMKCENCSYKFLCDEAGEDDE